MVPETGLAHMFSEYILATLGIFWTAGPRLGRRYAALRPPAFSSIPDTTKRALIPFGIRASFRKVPETGLEPARITPHAPKASVSTNSTTPASDFWYVPGWARPCPPGRIRTHDRSVKSRLLYQLSYERIDHKSVAYLSSFGNASQVYVWPGIVRRRRFLVRR